MPVTIPTQIKLTPAERAKIDELGRIWGPPERPLSMATVIRLAVQQAYDQEKANRKQQARKSK